MARSRRPISPPRSASRRRRAGGASSDSRTTASSAKRAALLDRESVGLPVLIFTTVRLATHGARALQEFEDAIRGFPEVIECYKLMGAADHVLKIVAPSVEAYEKFFRERLSQLPALREANSAIALSEVKCTTALPI